MARASDASGETISVRAKGTSVGDHCARPQKHPASSPVASLYSNIPENSDEDDGEDCIAVTVPSYILDRATPELSDDELSDSPHHSQRRLIDRVLSDFSDDEDEVIVTLKLPEQTLQEAVEDADDGEIAVAISRHILERPSPEPSDDESTSAPRSKLPPVVTPLAIEQRPLPTKPKINPKRSLYKPIPKYRPEPVMTAPWTQPLPERETPDLLMSLPAELRNRIYELALYNEHICHAGTKTSRQPHLLYASRQIRREALPLFYGTNLFVLHLNLARDDTIAGMCRWLGVIAAACHSSQPFGAWKIKVSGTVLVSLLSMLPIFELVRKDVIRKAGALALTDLTEMSNDAASVFKSQASSFLVGDAHGRWHPRGEMCTFLDRLLDLGEKARREGWSEELLRGRYRHVVTHKVVYKSTAALGKVLRARPPKPVGRPRGSGRKQSAKQE